MITVLPACVLVSLHINMAGRQKGRGNSNKIAMKPSMPPNTSRGSVKPSIVRDRLKGSQVVPILQCNR